MSWTKLGVAALVIAAVLIYWMTHAIWAATFLGVLFAISLIGPASWLRTKVRMPHWLATSLVMLVVVLVHAGIALLIGPSLTRQVGEMRTKLPAATAKVVAWLDERSWGERIVDRADEWLRLRIDPKEDLATAPQLNRMIVHGWDTGMDQPQIVSRASNAKNVTGPEGDSPATDGVAGSDPTRDEKANDGKATEVAPSGDQATGEQSASTKGGEASMANVGSVIRSGAGVANKLIETAALITVTLVLTVFITLDPRVHERGILWLVPKAREELARTTMKRLAVALRWWMLGRLISMIAIGGLTALGMWVVGMPVPVALGAIAGLLSFVPNIGPIVAAVPGVLLALTIGPWMVVWAICVYVVAQAIESYAVTPIVNHYAVATPPALVLVAQFVFSILGGVWGMIIATPALVVIMVLVQQHYVREGLKKPVHVTGSD